MKNLTKMCALALLLAPGAMSAAVTKNPVVAPAASSSFLRKAILFPVTAPMGVLDQVGSAVQKVVSTVTNPVLNLAKEHPVMARRLVAAVTIAAVAAVVNCYKNGCQGCPFFGGKKGCTKQAAVRP